MQRDDRPSTAEQDMYLQELVGKVLSDREESVLNLSKVVQDIEERLKWEQAANEQRWEIEKSAMNLALTFDARYHPLRSSQVQGHKGDHQSYR